MKTLKGKDIIKYINENNLDNKTFNMSENDLKYLLFVPYKVELYRDNKLVLKGTVIGEDEEFYTIKSKELGTDMCYNKSVYIIKKVI